MAMMQRLQWTKGARGHHSMGPTTRRLVPCSPLPEGWSAAAHCPKAGPPRQASSSELASRGEVLMSPTWELDRARLGPVPAVGGCAAA